MSRTLNSSALAEANNKNFGPLKKQGTTFRVQRDYRDYYKIALNAARSGRDTQALIAMKKKT